MASNISSAQRELYDLKQGYIDNLKLAEYKTRLVDICSKLLSESSHHKHHEHINEMVSEIQSEIIECQDEDELDLLRDKLWNCSKALRRHSFNFKKILQQQNRDEYTGYFDRRYE